MKVKFFSCLSILFFVSQFYAQSPKETPLLVIDNDPVYKADFLRVYNKNIDLVQDESQKNVDEYLKLFIDYKLKIKEAHALGYHKKPGYVKELTAHKKQLSKKFLTDNKVTDNLVEEAYNRISQDVKASHILVRINETASPKDTLQAYQKIVDLRKQALKEGFETVRARVHNGTTIFGEKLGYFTGFRMVYKFENAAYNTPVGNVSQPFRTQFGYHIVNVLDKRKSRGEITVAHIMIATKKDDKDEEASKTRINDIYKKVQQGEAFDALAKQFSDDKSSASAGGKMKPFTGGQISSELFENTAFELKNMGDVSKPIQTQFGWHIIKLHNRKLTPPLKDIKDDLEKKVKRDSRSQLINTAMLTKLRNKYKIDFDDKQLAYFESILTPEYYKGTWRLPKDFLKNKELLTIEKDKYIYHDFGVFLENYQNRIINKETYKTIVAKAYNKFLDEQLLKYQETHLEQENPDYAHVVEEYRDGLLLFELMNNTIWDASKSDSLKIKDFYKAHKVNYVWPKRIDAVVASSAKQKVLKKVAKLLESNVAIDSIKSRMNKSNAVDVIFTTGKMDKNHQALPAKVKFKKGVSKIYKHNDAYVVVQVKDVIPLKPKTLSEAKGQVTSDYQAQKEKNWLSDLRKKYHVTINKDVLEGIKNSIKTN